MKIGFIGLGAMGKHLAANLMKTGHELHIWNRSQPLVLLLQSQGSGGAITLKKFDPAGFPLKLALKDMKLVQYAAEECNVPMPMASILREQHIDGLAHGQEGQDWASLSRFSRRQAGLE